MSLLTTLDKILLFVFLVGSMLGMGLQTGTAAMRSLIAARRGLVRALLANFVVVPALGVALVLLLPLEPPTAAALVFLACTPGGLGALQFTSRVRADAALAGAVPIVLSVLSLVVTPVALRFALPPRVILAPTYGRALGVIALFTLVPLAVGLLFADRKPVLAAKLSKPLSLAGLVAFFTFMIVTRSYRSEALASIGGFAVLVMLAFILASMAIGWWFGGPTHDGRRIVASATSMRNAALCLAIAQAAPSGEVVMAPLLGFSLLMVPPNMLFACYEVIRARRRGRTRTYPGTPATPGGVRP